MSLQEGDKTNSLKQLMIIFIVGLMFFTIWRWDATSWVRAQLDVAISQSQLDVSYTELHLVGLHLQLDDVQIHAPDLPSPLILDKLGISPDWLAFMGLRWACLVEAEQALMMQVSASVAMHDEQLEIRDLTVKGDVAAMQAWLAYPLPVQLSGQIHLQGDMDVNIHTSQPLSGSLMLAWNGASLTMMQQQHRLGDYVLDFKINEQAGVWAVRGGKSVSIQGQGVLSIQAGPVTAWPLKGEIEFKADVKSSLAQLLPQGSQNAIISGELGAPHLQLKKTM